MSCANDSQTANGANTGLEVTIYLFRSAKLKTYESIYQSRNAICKGHRFA
jgi:hypothetical protein